MWNFSLSQAELEYAWGSEILRTSRRCTGCYGRESKIAGFYSLLLFTLCPSCLLPSSYVPQSHSFSVSFGCYLESPFHEKHTVFAIRDFPWNLARDVTCLHTLLLASTKVGLAESQFHVSETRKVMWFSAVSELECVWRVYSWDKYSSTSSQSLPSFPRNLIQAEDCFRLLPYASSDPPQMSCLSVDGRSATRASERDWRLTREYSTAEQGTSSSDAYHRQLHSSGLPGKDADPKPLM